MTDKKPTPRGTKVVAAALFGGLAAASIGQRVSPWVIASQTNTILVAVAGVIVAGVIAFVATKPKTS